MCVILRHDGTFSLQTMRSYTEDSNNKRWHIDYNIPFKFQTTAVYTSMGLMTGLHLTYHINLLFWSEVCAIACYGILKRYCDLSLGYGHTFNVVVNTQIR